MAERPRPTLSEMQNRLNKFEPAIRRVQNLPSRINEIVAEKKLKGLDGIEYLTRASELDKDIISTREKVEENIKLKTLIKLAEIRRNLEQEFKSSADEKIQKIKQDVLAGILPERILNQAQGYYFDLFGETALYESPNEEVEQKTDLKETNKELPVIFVNKNSKLLRVNNQIHQFDQTAISAIFWELIERSQEGLTVSDIKNLMLAKDKKPSNTPPSVQIGNLKRKLKDWMPDKDLIVSGGESSNITYKLEAKIEPFEQELENTLEESPDTEIFSSPLLNHPEMKQFVNYLPTNARNLVEKFFNNPRSSKFVDLVKNHLVNKVDDKDFYQNLSGALFEELGYEYLSEAYSKSDTFITTPDETLNFYSLLFPKKGITYYDGFLDKGIQGITTPDGLILRNEQTRTSIVGIVDYKMWAKYYPERNLEAQMEHYKYDNFIKDFSGSNNQLTGEEIGLALNKIVPNIPVKPLDVSPDLQIIYALPMNSEIILPTGIKREDIPFNSGVFGDFIDIFVKVTKEISKNDEIQETQNTLVPLIENDVNIQRKISILYSLVENFSNLTSVGRLRNLGISSITPQDVVFAESRGLISPVRERGNAKLSQKEIVILLLINSHIGNLMSKTHLDEFSLYFDQVRRERQSEHYS